MTPSIPFLPVDQDIETKAVLRAANNAHRYLGELKGAVAGIPNEGILIDTLAIQEAKDSSEIEQIITTHDEVYQAGVLDSMAMSPAAKEVQLYADALRSGFSAVAETGLIRQQDITALYQVIKASSAGYRKVPGTSIKNLQTGEVVHEPPQDAREIEALMANLVDVINDDRLWDADPLVKMAVIHHQFETIHPFCDGNGRTGRILNILYLVAQGLLGVPVLYLSRYIVRTKGEYYRLLQATRDDGDWEPWLLYMLQGVAETAESTLHTVKDISNLMRQTKWRIRAELPKIYSQDLLNNLFKYPYTKIDFVIRDLGVSRPTASRYLKELTNAGVLTEHKLGTSKFFINRPLFDLLRGIDGRTL